MAVSPSLEPSRSDSTAPPPAADVAVGIVLYCAVLFGAELIARYLLVGGLPDGFRFLNASRRHLLVATDLAANLLPRTAAAGFPMLLIVIALHRKDHQDPMRAVGLGSRRRDALLALAGAVAGLLAHVLLLLVLGAMAGAARGRPLYGLGEPLAKLANSVGRWRAIGWPSLLLLPEVLTYAAARLLLPHGHLRRLLSGSTPPVVAAGVVALVFTLPFAVSCVITPLALANLFLMGLVLERLDAVADSLWLPLTALAGWVVVGELAMQAYQGIPATSGPVLFRALPSLLTGGPAGPEGGLVATTLFVACLALLLRPRRRPRPAAGT